MAAANSRRPPTRLAHGLFFPAAALYGAFAVPASLAAMTGGLAALPGLATAAGHGHEMLFGYALAVVAGYLLGPQPRLRLGLLFGLWGLGRAAYVLDAASPWSVALDVGFALMLAGLVAPKFLSAAKKLRNQAFAPVLIGICAVAVLVRLAVPGERTLLWEAVLLFALLMLFMGGRVIAPMAAGQRYRQGENLDARVQPRLEGALIVLMAIAVIALPLPHGEWPAALALASAGAVAAVRLWRWRLWACQGRPDLIGLGVGYGWLAFGLMLLAGALFAERLQTAALHAITVGALGSLTLGVMARTRLLRVKRDPARAPVVVAGTALVSVAAVLRVVGGVEYQWGLMWAAAWAWAAAFLLLAGLLLWLQFGERIGPRIPRLP